MLVIREFEEMIVKLRSGAYDPIRDYNYRGPTHVSVGQEGTAAGACAALRIADNITSTHRGHGESLAKGTVAFRAMSEAALRARVPDCRANSREELSRRRSSSTSTARSASCSARTKAIAAAAAARCTSPTFPSAISAPTPSSAAACRSPPARPWPAATSATTAWSAASPATAPTPTASCSNSLNFAAQAQFTNHYADGRAFGLPIIFLVCNNHYGMTGRADDEVSGVSRLAQRAAGFADNPMHAEVVNGMNVLAVRDAVLRGAKLCREGKGPVLIEADCYRYWGHSLSDPRNEYRTKEEEAAWKAIDPIEAYKKELIAAGVLDAEGSKRWTARRRAQRARRQTRRRRRRSRRQGRSHLHVHGHEERDGSAANSPRSRPTRRRPEFKRVNGEITYKDALREALAEEMTRDNRVVFYGEDVADYGGAFKVTKGLLETFGRHRVFNTPISEACICGTAVGAAMRGLRPVVELMYFDFALMSSDQISNQAAKWHYMSGAQTEVPLVIRASAGGGKGYGGQHSQTLESIFCHIPGLYVIYPSTPADAKGLLKSAIRDNNPVLFIESQLLYGMKGPVAEGEHLVPLGVADVKREGADITFVSWGPVVHDCLKAAERLAAERNVTRR